MIRDPGDNNPRKTFISHSLGFFWMGEGRGGLVGRATVTCFFLAGGRQPAVPGSAELLASLGFLIKRETLHLSLLLFFCGNHMVCCAFRGAVFCAHHCAVRGPVFVLMIEMFGALFLCS